MVTEPTAPKPSLAVERLVFMTDTGVRRHDRGEEADAPVVRAAALIVISHPYGDGCDDAVAQALADLSFEIGGLVTPRLAGMLDVPVSRYGKGAIAGTGGGLAQLAALLHPRLGKPMRQAIGGGQAIIPSTQKIGGPGTWLDVPIAHKDDPWSFAAIDTFTLGLADAPSPAQHVLMVVLAGDPAHPTAD